MNTWFKLLADINDCYEKLCCYRYSYASKMVSGIKNKSFTTKIWLYLEAIFYELRLHRFFIVSKQTQISTLHYELRKTCHI